MKSNLIDLLVEEVHRTASAILVTDGGPEVWLPLSQIEVRETDKADIVEITLPEWLALDKGLI